MVLWLGVLPRCSFWLGTSEGLTPGRLMMTMNYLGSRCAQGYTMRLCQRLRTRLEWGVSRCDVSGTSSVCGCLE